MHLLSMTVTSLYKEIFLDLHLITEVKLTVGFTKVILREFESFDSSTLLVSELFNMIHSTVSFWLMDVHIKDKTESVPLFTKLLIIDPFSTFPPLLRITGPKYKYKNLMSRSYTPIRGEYLNNHQV